MVVPSSSHPMKSHSIHPSLDADRVLPQRWPAPNVSPHPCEINALN
jgi:hypothetical protein